MIDEEKRKKIAEKITEIRKLLMNMNPSDKEYAEALLSALESLEEDLRLGYILQKKKR
ncbi:MAG: hypothetical protein QXK87_06980 [Fervidicoccaceae archaeon]